MRNVNVQDRRNNDVSLAHFNVLEKFWYAVVHLLERRSVTGPWKRFLVTRYTLRGNTTDIFLLFITIIHCNEDHYFFIFQLLD